MAEETGTDTGAANTTTGTEGAAGKAAEGTGTQTAAAGTAAVGAAGATGTGTEGGKTTEGTEGQANQANGKAADDGAGKGDKTADAPLDYTALKLPEGYSQDQKDPVFGEAVKLFGEHKIAPDVAQKLIDFTVTRDKAMVEALNEQNAANWQKQVDAWKADSTKEFSAESLGEAKTALPQVFDADTVKWMDGLGLTNHPGFIRAMVKVAKAIKDDTWVSGNAGQVNGSDARKAFPNSNMNP